LETVIDGKTGVFFDELTEESLVKAIKRLSGLSMKSEVCRKQAEKFSKERFVSEIKKFVAEKAKK
jgi:glycosyltransferase involved in cell wall biosynthesis